MPIEITPHAYLEKKVVTSGVAVLDINKTLIIGNFSNDPSIQDSVNITKIHSQEEAYKKFNPFIQLDLENDKGENENEIINFTKVGDFDENNIINNVGILKKQLQINNELEEIIQKLKNDKRMQKAILEQKAMLLELISHAKNDLLNSKI